VIVITHFGISVCHRKYGEEGEKMVIGRELTEM
jgi:hypothetical protein